MPLPIRRDYFRENMKVTSCPWTTLPTRRHKSRTSVGAAERRTRRAQAQGKPTRQQSHGGGGKGKISLVTATFCHCPCHRCPHSTTAPAPPCQASASLPCNIFSWRKQFRDIKQKPAGCPEMASWPPPSAQSPLSPMIWWQTS